MEAETWPLVYQSAVHVCQHSNIQTIIIIKDVNQNAVLYMFIDTDSWPSTVVILE